MKESRIEKILISDLVILYFEIVRPRKGSGSFLFLRFTYKRRFEILRQRHALRRVIGGAQKFSRTAGFCIFGFKFSHLVVIFYFNWKDLKMLGNRKNYCKKIYEFRI